MTTGTALLLLRVFSGMFLVTILLALLGVLWRVTTDLALNSLFAGKNPEGDDAGAN